MKLSDSRGGPNVEEDSVYPLNATSCYRRRLVPVTLLSLCLIVSMLPRTFDYTLALKDNLAAKLRHAPMQPAASDRNLLQPDGGASAARIQRREGLLSRGDAASVDGNHSAAIRRPVGQGAIEAVCGAESPGRMEHGQSACMEAHL